MRKLIAETKENVVGAEAQLGSARERRKSQEGAGSYTASFAFRKVSQKVSHLETLCQDLMHRKKKILSIENR